MKIRTRFFLIFTLIAIFTFAVSSYISVLSIKKIVNRQTEQTLSTALYTNYSYVKNLLTEFPLALSSEIKARQAFKIIDNNNISEIEKNAEEIYKSLKLDYLQIKQNENFIYYKNPENLPEHIFSENTESLKNNFFMTEQGLVITNRLAGPENSSVSIIVAKIINKAFLKNLYHENVNIVFYWNGEVFLSSISIFDKNLETKNIFLNENQFEPSEITLVNWEKRNYKLIYQSVFNSGINELDIGILSSTLFEEEIIFNTISSLLITLLAFLIILLIISYIISGNIMEPFYDLAIGISKKDKISIKPLLARNDEIGNLANEFWNITEDLLKQQEQKEQINSLITHDLKTPLVAVTRSLETIRDNEQLSREQKVFFINMMIKQCNQSLDLINNLLKVQKYELGKMNLFMSEENFNNLVEESVFGLKPLADKKDIKINLNLDNKNYKILIDRTELLRVINNLISNAIKYSNQNGNIFISTRITDLWAEFVINDQGQGIPYFEQRKLFNFYKSAYTNTEDKESSDLSTGLGLYLCKQIIEAHGGEIGFKSLNNKGSTFYFKIPLR